MALPIATTTVEVQAPGEPARDAQRRKVRTLWDEPRGPYGAHVTSLRRDRRDVAPEQQTRAADLYLEPEAWPVLPGYRLRDLSNGELYDVQAAVKVGDGELADLEHVQATCLRVEP